MGNPAGIESGAGDKVLAIPDVGQLFDPFLRAISDGKDYQIAEVTDVVAAKFQLSDEELRTYLPSGKQFIFRNRMGWARTYLKKAGLVSYSSWGVFQISDEGKKALKDMPDGGIDLQFLKKYPSFLEFYSPSSTIGAVKVVPVQDAKDEEKQLDPEEAIEVGAARLRSQLTSELLAKIKTIPSEAFEELVVRLLTGMGYGGSQTDAGQALGRSGDGGIDGIIREDRLGLDLIYLQAKRWEGNVGRPVVQSFVGALHGRHAARGVLLTTSSFTKEAEDYAKSLGVRVILLTEKSW